MTPDDSELVTLARSARARNAAMSGACVRDLEGQTHVATNVGLPSLTVSSLELAIAMAVSSGAGGLEAAAVVTEDDDIDLTAVRDLAGGDVPVYLADITGQAHTVWNT